VDLILGTMSKSLGSTGGFVCGSSSIINYIRYFARSCMFSAAPSPMVMAGVSASLDVIRDEPQLREKLWENAHYMFDELKARGFTVGPMCTPIIPVIVGSMKALRQMTLDLHQKNICVNSIPFPAVPHGEERLRVSVTAKHTREQLKHAIDCIEEAGRSAGVLPAG
jgi:7-keto-8-aminopelargonate synthetase-like enzyme